MMKCPLICQIVKMGFKVISLKKNYCFKQERHTLWHEAAARGYLAAILDFPRMKSHEESYAAAKGVYNEMRPEVCCIISRRDEEMYYQLIVAAWCTFYRALEFMSEREIVFEASVFKRLSWDEGLCFVRRGFVDPSACAEVDRVYERFVEMSAQRA